MSTLALYLSRLYFGRTIGAVLALASLVQIVDLIEATTEVLDRGLGLRGIGYYALLRLPLILTEAFPLGALVGALIAFAGLVRGNEVSVLRACGLSSLRIVGFMFPAALLLAALHFGLADQLAPRAERAFTLWWSETAPAKKDSRPEPKWFRVDPYLVAVERIGDQGRRLEGVRIYEHDQQQLVTRRIAAEAAIFKQGRWRLSDPMELVVEGDKLTVRPLADPFWQVGLEPIDVLGLFTPTGRVSATTAYAVLAGERIGSRAPPFYSTLLFRSLADPLGAFLMILLASPAAFRLRRSGTAGGFLLGLTTGLVFLLFKGIAATFGEVGLVPPLVAVFAPLVAFTGLGVSFLMGSNRS